MTDMYLKVGMYVPMEDWERSKFELLYAENPEESRKFLVGLLRPRIKSGVVTFDEIGVKGFPACFCFPEEKL